jgi:hypothetical protein
MQNCVTSPAVLLFVVAWTGTQNHAHSSYFKPVHIYKHTYIATCIFVYIYSLPCVRVYMCASRRVWASATKWCVSFFTMIVLAILESAFRSIYLYVLFFFPSWLSSRNGRGRFAASTCMSFLFFIFLFFLDGCRRLTGGRVSLNL